MANMQQDLVNVCIRFRPLIQREVEQQMPVLWQSTGNEVFRVNDEGRQLPHSQPFAFDHVFDASKGTQSVYETMAKTLVNQTMEGFNGTIFAYGQTSTGKTHTMLGTEAEPGIIPLSISEVFQFITKNYNMEFLLRVSYMEIYNEEISDMLKPENRNLKIRTNETNETFVDQLTEIPVVSKEEILSLMERGETNRHFGQTNMNERSSRSHTVFRLIIESRNKKTDDDNYDGAVRVSRLNLVDLAGAERARQTGAQGTRLKESGYINRSLLTLGIVISKLSEDESTFVPYRDSKLTRILQDSLGGNSKTVMICTVTPVSSDVTESTLKFASRAKRIKNKPQVNEVLDGDTMLRRYKMQIRKLESQIDNMRAEVDVTKMEELLEEKTRREAAQQQQIEALKRFIVSSQVERKKATKRRQTICATYVRPSIKRTLETIEDEDESKSEFAVPLDVAEARRSWSSPTSVPTTRVLPPNKDVYCQTESLPRSELRVAQTTSDEDISDLHILKRDLAEVQNKYERALKELQTVRREDQCTQHTINELKHQLSLVCVERDEAKATLAQRETHAAELEAWANELHLSMESRIQNVIGQKERELASERAIQEDLERENLGLLAKLKKVDQEMTQLRKEIVTERVSKGEHCLVQETEIKESQNSNNDRTLQGDDITEGTTVEEVTKADFEALKQQLTAQLASTDLINAKYLKSLADINLMKEKVTTLAQVTGDRDQDLEAIIAQVRILRSEKEYLQSALQSCMGKDFSLVYATKKESERPRDDMCYASSLARETELTEQTSNADLSFFQVKQDLQNEGAVIVKEDTDRSNSFLGEKDDLDNYIESRHEGDKNECNHSEQKEACSINAVYQNDSRVKEERETMAELPSRVQGDTAGCFLHLEEKEKLLKDIENLSSLLNEKGEAMKSLEKEFVRLQSECNAECEECKRMVEDVANLDLQVKNKDEAIRELQTRLENKESDVLVLTEEKEKLKGELERLRTDCPDCHLRASEKEKLLNEIGNLSSLLKDKEDEVKSLEEKFVRFQKECNAECEECKKMVEGVANLDLQVKNRDETIRELQTRLENKENDIFVCTKENEKLKTDISELHSHLDENQRQLNARINEVKELTNEISALNMEVEDGRKAIQILESRLYEEKNRVSFQPQSDPVIDVDRLRCDLEEANDKWQRLLQEREEDRSERKHQQSLFAERELDLEQKVLTLQSEKDQAMALFKRQESLTTEMEEMLNKERNLMGARLEEVQQQKLHEVAKERGIQEDLERENLILLTKVEEFGRKMERLEEEVAQERAAKEKLDEEVSKEKKMRERLMSEGTNQMEAMKSQLEATKRELEKQRQGEREKERNVQGRHFETAVENSKEADGQVDRAEFEAMKNALATYTASYDLLNGKFCKTGEEIRGLKEKMAAQLQVIETKNRDIQSVGQLVKSLTLEKEGLQAELASHLARDQEALNARGRENEKLKQEMAELRTELESLRVKSKKLEDSIKEDSRVKALEGKLRENTDRLHVAEVELLREKVEKDKLEEALRSARTEFVEVDALNKLRIRGLTDEIRRLKNQAAETESTVSGVDLTTSQKPPLTVCQWKYDEVKTKLQSVEYQLGSKVKRIRELEAENNRLGICHCDVTNRLEALKGEMNHLKDQSERKLKEKNLLIAKLKASSGLCSVTEDSQRKSPLKENCNATQPAPISKQPRKEESLPAAQRPSFIEFLERRRKESVANKDRAAPVQPGGFQSAETGLTLPSWLNETQQEEKEDNCKQQ